MSARRRAQVVPLPTPEPAARPCESMLMSEPEWGLRLLILALDGLEANARVNDLDSEDVQREVAPLIALTYDIQDALKRERALMQAAVDARGEEA